MYKGANSANIAKAVTLITFSRIGDYFQFTALVILIKNLGGDAKSIGILLVLHQLPVILMSGLGAKIGRNIDQRKYLAVCDCIRAILTLGFIATNQLWLLYFFAFVHYSISASCSPVALSMLPKIVEPQHIPKINMLTSVAFTGAAGLGGVLSGLIISSLSLNLAFVIDAFTFLVSACCVLSLKYVKNQNPQKSVKDKFNKSWQKVWKYLIEKKKLFIIFLMPISQGGFAGILWVTCLNFATNNKAGTESANSIAFVNTALMFGNVLGPVIFHRFFYKGAEIKTLNVLKNANLVRLFLCLIITGLYRLDIFFSESSIMFVVFWFFFLMCISGLGAINFLSIKNFVHAHVSENRQKEFFSIFLILGALCFSISSFLTSIIIDNGNLTYVHLWYLMSIVSLFLYSCWRIGMGYCRMLWN